MGGGGGCDLDTERLLDTGDPLSRELSDFTTGLGGAGEDGALGRPPGDDPPLTPLGGDRGVGDAIAEVGADEATPFRVFTCVPEEDTLGLLGLLPPGLW